MVKRKGAKGGAPDIALEEPGPSTSGEEDLSSVVYIGYATVVHLLACQANAYVNAANPWTNTPAIHCCRHLPHGFYEKELLGKPLCMPSLRAGDCRGS